LWGHDIEDVVPAGRIFQKEGFPLQDRAFSPAFDGLYVGAMTQRSKRTISGKRMRTADRVSHARKTRAGAAAHIGGVEIRIARPKVRLEADKIAKIRAAVRSVYGPREKA
jgi:hypothetical protein